MPVCRPFHGRGRRFLHKVIHSRWRVSSVCRKRPAANGRLAARPTHALECRVRGRSRTAADALRRARFDLVQMDAVARAGGGDGRIARAIVRLFRS
jgi:hypothetical protein